MCGRIIYHVILSHYEINKDELSINFTEKTFTQTYTRKSVLSGKFWKSAKLLETFWCSSFLHYIYIYIYSRTVCALNFELYSFIKTNIF